MRSIMMALLVLGLGAATVDAGGRGRRSSTPSSGTGASSSSRSVKGYTTKKGTYVAPHKRSAPDRTQRNNYTTKGNTNPYTGKAGTARATK
jgi:hypothetical protein